MGQYYKGTKIGTCGSMYYLRLQDAQKLAGMGARDDDGINFASMLEDNETMFRFPFPKEDGHALAGTLVGIIDYSPSFMLPAGCIEDVGHDTICVSNKHADGSHSINMMLPCPYSKEFKALGIKMSTGGAGEQFLAVKMQAMREGEEKTIFACARCGQLQRFSSDDVEKIKERSREYFASYDCTGKGETYAGNQGLYDYAIKVIERIK